MRKRSKLISPRLNYVLFLEGYEPSDMGKREIVQTLREIASVKTEAELLRLPNVGRKTLSEFKEVAGLSDGEMGKDEEQPISAAQPIANSINFDVPSLVKDIEQMVSENLSIFIEREASKQVRDYVKATSYQLRGMVETEVRNLILLEIQKQNLDQHITEMVKSAVRKVSAS